MGTNRKIKICQLISGDLWAGAEAQMFTMVKGLRDIPDLSLSAIILNEGRLAEKLREEPFDVTVIDERKNGFRAILKELQKTLAGRNIDIVHSHRYKENILAGMLKKKGHVGHLVQTVHGLFEKLSGIKKIKMATISQINYYFSRRYFDRIVPVSFDIKNGLAGRLDSAKMTVIHNAINAGSIKANRGVSAVKAELNIEPKQPVIGTAGRLVPIKGYDLFLDMAKIILETRPDAVFWLIGDGPLKQQLQARAANLDLSDKVKFLGFRDDIVDLLNCLDIFVISSHHEGIPMVLLEAMALKRAITATAVGGINEIIENGKSGILVNPGDAPALAQACLGILDDDNRRQTLGDGAASRIAEEFSIDIQTRRMLELYREVAA